MELIYSSLNEAISQFCFLNAINGFLDWIEGLKAVSFGILKSMPISNIEEHISE